MSKRVPQNLIESAPHLYAALKLITEAIKDGREPDAHEITLAFEAIELAERFMNNQNN